MNIQAIWKGILNMDNLSDDTDFFASGAGSMDVTRLVEEVKQKCAVELANEDVYMGPTLGEFVRATILKQRAGASGGAIEVKYNAVRRHVEYNEINILG